MWRRVGFGVGAEALQGARFNQLCVGEAGGKARAGRELGSLALPALRGFSGILKDFGVVGWVHPGAKT